MYLSLLFMILFSVFIYVKKVEIKQKVTADFILDLYDKAKKMKSQERKAKMLKQIKVLSQHLGHYIVKPLDSE